MYSFKTKDGVEYLGDRDILVNPCGDYINSIDVITGFRTWDSDNFYADSEITDSQMLPSLKIEIEGSPKRHSSDTDAISKQSLLCMNSEGLLSMIDVIIKEELPNIIKEWVMRNIYSDSRIIIRLDALATVEGMFSIREGAKVPPYLHLKIKNS